MQKAMKIHRKVSALPRRKRAYFLVPCLIAAACAALFLFLFSKCSPLYPFNEWCDVNWFMDMGRGWAEGKIPYRDLFEQKGPLVYLMFLAVYLLFGANKTGVLFLEMLSLFLFLLLSYRILRLSLSRRLSLLALPVIALFVTTSNAFYQGGGAVEEYCLPLLAFGLFCLLSYLGDRAAAIMPFSRLFLCGVAAGCILLIKYTMLAFYFALMASLFFTLLFRREARRAWLSCVVFLLGMAAIIVPFVWYFAGQGALAALFRCYIYDNIFRYVAAQPLAERMLSLLVSYSNMLQCLPLYLGVLFSVLLVATSPTVTRQGKLIFAFVVSFTVLVQVLGFGRYPYYHLMVAMFLPSGVAGACLTLPRVRHSLRRRQARRTGGAATSLPKPVRPPLSRPAFARCVALPVLLCVALCGPLFGNSVRCLADTREDYVQFRFADRLWEEEAAAPSPASPTLLVYGIQEYGFYNACGISPSSYFYAMNNFTEESYPELFAAQREEVTEGKVDYVICPLKRYENEGETVFANYRLLATETLDTRCHSLLSEHIPICLLRLTEKGENA